MSSRFIGYTRVSTDKQSENSSFENQKREIEEYIKAKDGVLLEIYKETFTGKEDERPELMKAIQDCKDLNARLIVSKLDRLSRHVPFIVNFTEKFEIEFVVVEFPDQYSKHMLYIFSIFAEMERDMISERTKEALRAKIASGEYKPTGANLEGIKRNPKPGIEANIKAKAKHRRTIYKELERICEDFHNKHERYPYIEETVSLLNERQNKTIKGSKWSYASLTKLLFTGREKKELHEFNIHIISKDSCFKHGEVSKNALIKQEKQKRIQKYLEDEKLSLEKEEIKAKEEIKEEIKEIKEEELKVEEEEELKVEEEEELKVEEEEELKVEEEEELKVEEEEEDEEEEIKIIEIKRYDLKVNHKKKPKIIFN